MLQKFFTKINKPIIWIFLLFTLIASARFLTNLNQTVYQCDEYSYLRKSYFADHYFSGDFQNPDWQNGDAYDQTKLMEYVYAIPSYLLYGKDFISLAQEESVVYNQSYTNYSDWAVTYGQPASQLNISSKLFNVLILGRAISAFFTIIYILVTCLIIYRLFNSFFITSLGFIFLLFHPIINIHGKQILADSTLNALLALGLLVLLNWWSALLSSNHKKLISLTIFSGFIGGLSASAKLNGFVYPIISSTVMFIGLLLTLKKGKLKISSSRILGLFLLNLNLSLVIFFLLHPSLWQNPFKGINKFLSWRWDITNYYRDYFPEDNLQSFLDVLKAIFLRTAGYMPGVGSIGFHYESRFSTPNQAFYLLPNLFLFFTGLFQLIKLNFKTKFTKKPLLPITVFSFLSIVVVIYYLKLDWTRYYWPLILPILIINGYGLSSLINFIKKRK